MASGWNYLISPNCCTLPWFFIDRPALNVEISTCKPISFLFYKVFLIAHNWSEKHWMDNANFSASISSGTHHLFFRSTGAPVLFINYDKMCHVHDQEFNDRIIYSNFGDCPEYNRVLNTNTCVGAIYFSCRGYHQLFKKLIWIHWELKFERCLSFKWTPYSRWHVLSVVMCIRSHEIAETGTDFIFKTN